MRALPGARLAAAACCVTPALTQSSPATGAIWHEMGLGLCEHQEHPYGEELKTVVPEAFRSNWAPDRGPMARIEVTGFATAAP